MNEINLDIGVLKWWSKCVSIAITKTVIRNIAFKAAKMSVTALEFHSAFLPRGVGGERRS